MMANAWVLNKTHVEQCDSCMARTPSDLASTFELHAMTSNRRGPFEVTLVIGRGFILSSKFVGTVVSDVVLSTS